MPISIDHGGSSSLYLLSICSRRALKIRDIGRVHCEQSVVDKLSFIDVSLHFCKLFIHISVRISYSDFKKNIKMYKKESIRLLDLSD